MQKKEIRKHVVTELDKYKRLKKINPLIKKLIEIFKLEI